jgi:F-box/TPR repeat protein Pof3
MVKHALERFSIHINNEEESQSKRSTTAIQLHALEEQIKSAFIVRDKVLAAQTGCHIAQLPAELLAEVFSYLVLTKQSRIFVLTATCRHWRAFCLNTPALWHTLHMTDDKRARKRAEALIVRSNGYIRNLIIDDMSHESILTSIEPLLNIHWEMLCSLIINLPPLANWDKIRAALTKASGLSYLPKLQTVEITRPLEQRLNRATPHSLSLSGITYEVGPKPHENDAICFSPIRNVVLRSLTPSSQAYAYWTSLSTLTIDAGLQSFPAEQIIEILARNPNLRVLFLNMFYTPRNFPPLHPYIELLQLEELTLGTRSTAILQLLKCPTLRTLHFMKMGNEASLGSHLDRLAHRSDCLTRLEHLRIEEYAITDPEALLSFIRARHGLRRLAITSTSTGVDFISRGLVDACPLIEHIDFSHCSDVRTSPLIKLVKAHLPDSALDTGDGLLQPLPLNTLIVDGCTHIEADTIPWFRNHVKDFRCQYMSKKEASYKR